MWTVLSPQDSPLLSEKFAPLVGGDRSTGPSNLQVHHNVCRVGNRMFRIKEWVVSVRFQ